MKLTYDQLRRILALLNDNSVLKAKLDAFFAGKLTGISETDILGLISSSEIDKDMIRILTGNDPDTMDALDGLQAIADFFAYVRANKARLSGWLESIGYRVVSKAKTGSKPSK